jgi:hypothetical protein
MKDQVRSFMIYLWEIGYWRLYVGTVDVLRLRGRKKQAALLENPPLILFE